MTGRSPYGDERTCAVLGSPIEHSLSPALHRAAYRALGLAWAYERHEVTDSGLAGFVDALGPRWRGLSLTMPCKVAAMTVGEPDPVATAVGVANTLVFDGDRRLAYNTDVGGLVDAVRAVGVSTIERAVLLGSGATARSAIVSLGRLGCRSVHVIARTPARAAELTDLATAQGMTLTVAGWTTDVPDADLVLSTVTAGAADGLAAAAAGAAPVVFDVVYDPWPTGLAAAAEAAGAAAVSGLDLLAHQAVGQLRLMTGLEVDAEVLLSAGRAELDRRAAR
ncbi:shikimate dehydrogenase [Microlunatus sp. Y2014]|uniref:shikimate dehydrogenase n=1 Tax=Microlunatus sp. Y2014 TaxID=3418488 RepID=UPI003DA72B56